MPKSTEKQLVKHASREPDIQTTRIAKLYGVNRTWTTTDAVSIRFKMGHFSVKVSAVSLINIIISVNSDASRVSRLKT